MGQKELRKHAWAGNGRQGKGEGVESKKCERDQKARKDPRERTEEWESNEWERNLLHPLSGPLHHAVLGSPFFFTFLLPHWLAPFITSSVSNLLTLSHSRSLSSLLTSSHSAPLSLSLSLSIALSLSVSLSLSLSLSLSPPLCLVFVCLSLSLSLYLSPPLSLSLSLFLSN